MEQLIVVFTERRNIGLVAIPYIATINEEQPITLHEHATLLHLKSENKFSEEEKAIIELLHKISDQYLFKKYAREGTLKAFFDKVNIDPRFEPLIKPHIEENTYKAVKLLASSSIPSYYKNGAFSNLYQSDLLFIFPTPAIPYCIFDLKDDQLLYSLRVKQNMGDNIPEKEFSMLGKTVDFLCHDPAVFKINNQLFYFENIDSKKFKPFLEKQVISIPSRQVPTYMEGFVAGCIRHYQVEAHGFIIEDASKSPSALLKILKDLNQQAALALHFCYRDRTFLADRKSAIFVDLEKAGEQYRFKKIQRNFEFEQRVIDLLMKMGLEKINDALFRPIGNDVQSKNTNQLSSVVTWLNHHLHELTENKITISSDYESNQLFLGKISVNVDSTAANDWFEIKTNIQIGEFSIPFFRFRKHLISGQNGYQLPNSELFIIPDEWFTRFSELLNYAKFDGDTIRLPKSHFRILDQVKYGISEILREEKEIRFPDVKLPDGLLATLRPYQKEGFIWLNFLFQNNFGGILADDMGLGKTLQTIALLLHIYNKKMEAESKAQEKLKKTGQLSIFDVPETASLNESGVPASLICVPTTLLHNWQDELKKFAPTLKAYLYAGGNRLKSKEIGKIFRHYHVVITSYGVLRNDIELLKNYRFHYFIVDESQYVKNPASKIYEAVKSIEANNHLGITGTPIENSLIDLWTQMDLVNKGLLGSLPFFKRHFVVPITRNQDESKEAKLQKLIQPFLLRRTKEKVADDLPPVMEQVLYCDMTPEQESFYEREKSGIRNSIYKVFESKTPEQSAIMALQALTRLRQIANHPVLVDEKYKGSSGKFEQILENLENVVAENHNVLIFSSFVKDLELIEKELQNRGYTYAKLTGATQKREQVIKSFSQTGECRIFLISLKAGGVGLNLTKADYVFMLNPWWNPAAESQAINRAHRIGQTKNVFVYRFLSTGSIEEKIAKLQERKARLADTFVSSNNPLKDLSKQEIMELFS